MIIKNINLVNFRNHDTYNLDCQKDTTLIIGKNGCGKTSVLEAIYILTQGKSFRATDPEILKRGKEFYRIELLKENGEKIISTYDGKNKTFNVLDKKTHRLTKKDKYPIILFLPSDLNLIHSSPSRRREYFDRFFSQLNEEYNNLIKKYDKAIHQRNELLKSPNPTKDALFSWNLLLAKYGTRINLLRNNFIDEINLEFNKIYYSIANHQDDIKIIYETDLIVGTEENYLKTLEQNYEKDIYLGHTSFGIHRDDIKFKFNHKDADGSASRGEVRSIMLALKFIEANMIFKYLQQKPIVLLDDVFSELDHERRNCLVKNFKDHQVIITSVENIELPIS